MELKELKEFCSDFTVLYVEDDPNIADNFQRYLSKLFKQVDYEDNGEDGLESYKINRHDIVITDITMPKMDGLKMSEYIKSINSEQNILITSAYSETEKFIHSIKIGIDGYILKPIDYEALNLLLYKVVKKLKTFNEHALYEHNLEELVEEKTRENLTLEFEKVENYEKTLFALIEMIDSRDRYTGRHSVRVARYSKMIAQEMGFSEEECNDLYRAGILHDLGKIAIPDSLLLKPGKLTENEYSLIKEHVTIGSHLLEQIPMFHEISKVIECHHERIDGSGYPKGLKSDEISLKGNIMALADSFDAMTTNRIYKGRKGILEALDEIKSLEGIHFKKAVVAAGTKVLQSITIDNSITQRPTTKLEQERFSYFYKDILTQTFNESYLDYVLAQNKIEERYNCLYIVFLDSFGDYNKKHSWSQGNRLLSQIAHELISYFPNDKIFRIHGDDFVIISDVPLVHEEEVKKLQKLLSEHGESLSCRLKEVELLKNQIFSFEKFEEFI